MTTENPYRVMLVDVFSAIIGHEREVHQITEGLTEPEPRSFQIVGFRSLGTNLLMRFISRLAAMDDSTSLHRAAFLRAPFNEPGRFLPIYIDCMQFSHSRTLTAWLLQQLEANRLLQGYVPVIVDRPSPVVIIQELLLAVTAAGRRAALLLDNLDHALKALPKAEATQLRPLVGLAGFVTTSEHPLVRINEDAASSWFGNLLYQINSVMLSPSDAHQLLRSSPTMPDNVKELSASILPLTGYHSTFILRGAAEWYDLKQRYSSLRADELRTILHSQLYQEFRPDFIRFWNNIAPSLRESLQTLCGQSTQSVLKQHLPRLDQLTDMGLVAWNDQRHTYEPFSTLWAEFIKEKIADEANVRLAKLLAPAQHDYTRLEQDLLAYLQKHRGEICTYQDILQDVWHTDPTPRTVQVLRQSILRLRQKIDREGDVGGKIINHKGRGYEYHVE